MTIPASYTGQFLKKEAGTLVPALEILVHFRTV